MKNNVLKAVIALMLSAAVLLPTGETPFFSGVIAHAETDVTAEIPPEENAEPRSVEPVSCAASSVLAAPTASKKSGTYDCKKNTLTVELRSKDKATIYYSLNGAKYKKYTKPLRLTKNSTVKTYAMKNGRKSAVVTYKYKLKPVLRLYVDANEPAIVKVGTDVKDMKLYFTSDGSKPTENSFPLYDGVIMDRAFTLRVLAVKKGWSKAYFSMECTPPIKHGEEAYSKPKTGSANVSFDSIKAAVAVQHTVKDDGFGDYNEIYIPMPDNNTTLEGVWFTIPDSVSLVKGKELEMGYGNGLCELYLEDNVYDGGYYHDELILKPLEAYKDGKRPSTFYFCYKYTFYGQPHVAEGKFTVLLNSDCSATSGQPAAPETPVPPSKPAVTVTAPYSTLASGTYEASEYPVFTLENSTPGADIYYREGLSGKYVKFTGNSGALQLVRSCDLYIYSEYDGVKSSEVKYSYYLQPKVDFEVKQYDGYTTVKLSSGLDNVELRYTTNGTEVTKYSPRYTGELRFTESCMLNVLAIKPDCTWNYVYKNITVKPASAGNTEQLGEGKFTVPLTNRANIRYNGETLSASAEYSATYNIYNKYDSVRIALSGEKTIDIYIAADEDLETGDTLRALKTDGGVSNIVLGGFGLGSEWAVQSSDRTESKYFDKAEIKAVSIDYTGVQPSVLYFYILAHDDNGKKTALEGMVKVFINNSKHYTLGGVGNTENNGNNGNNGNTGNANNGNTAADGAYTSLDGKYSVDLGEGKVNVDGKLYSGKAYNNNTSGYDRFDIDFDNDKKWVRIAQLENCVNEGATDDIKSYRDAKRQAGRGLPGIWVGFGGLGFYTDPSKDSVSSNTNDYINTVFSQVTTTYETYRDGVVTIRFHMEYRSYNGEERHTIDGYCAIPYKESGSSYCMICTGTGKCQNCMGTTLGSKCTACHGTKKCRYCKGKGSTPSLNEFSCPMCAGQGRCRNCYGDGMIYDAFSGRTTTCRSCNGAGICLYCDGSGTVAE